MTFFVVVLVVLVWHFLKIVVFWHVLAGKKFDVFWQILAGKTGRVVKCFPEKNLTCFHTFFREKLDLLYICFGMFCLKWKTLKSLKILLQRRRCKRLRFLKVLKVLKSFEKICKMFWWKKMFHSRSRTELIFSLVSSGSTSYEDAN